MNSHATCVAQDCASFKKSRSISRAMSHAVAHGTRSTSSSSFSSVPGPLPPRRLSWSHPQHPAQIHGDHKRAAVILNHLLTQVMSPTGSSTTRSLMNRRTWPAQKTIRLLKWGSCQSFVPQPVLLVFNPRLGRKHCYATRSRLRRRTNSCSAGVTAVPTGGRMKCGTIASLSESLMSVSSQGLKSVGTGNL